MRALSPQPARVQRVWALYTDTVNADADSQSERSWTIFEQVWEAQR